MGYHESNENKTEKDEITKRLNANQGKGAKVEITQNELTVNGKKYVLADSVKENAKAESKDGLEYKLFRGDRSGVFAGYLKSLNGKEAIVLDCRRIWYWTGAASISQLAIDGTNNPTNCKFPEAVSKMQLTDVIEVLDVTAKAKASIDSVKIWKA
jgi:hypothetical protein